MSPDRARTGEMTFDLAMVLAGFDFSQPTEIVDESLPGQSNSAWVVRSEGRDYILKRHTGYRGKAHLAAEERVLELLRQQPLPFALPTHLPIRSGQPFIERNGELFTLQPRILGRPVNPAQAAECRASGRALGKLHRAMNRLAWEADLADLYRPWPYLGQQLDGTSHLQVSAADGKAEACLIWFNEQCNRMDESIISLIDGLPAQLLHGDIVPGNLLWDQGRIAAVLDFEFVCHGPKVLDVAMALTFFIHYWTGQDAIGAISAFLDGYEAVMPIDPEDRAVIPGLIGVQNVASARWWLASAQRKGMATDGLLTRVLRTRDFDGWLQDNWPAIIKAVMGRGR